MQDLFKNQLKDKFIKDLNKIFKNKSHSDENFQNQSQSAQGFESFKNLGEQWSQLLLAKWTDFEKLGLMMAQDFKSDFNEKMAQFGIADRWPAWLAFIEEFIPQSKSLPLIQLLAKKYEPVLSWIPHKINCLEDHQVEIVLSPAPHLLQEGGAWDTTVVAATAALPAKWLMQKHGPPGALKINVVSLEIQIESSLCEAGDLYLRTSMGSDEIESSIQKWLQDGKNTIENHVSYFNEGGQIKAQAQVKLECLWTPMIDSTQSSQLNQSSQSMQTTNTSQPTQS